MSPVNEFSFGAAEWPEELSRRRFLKLMGASLALAGTGACTRNPPEHILPYLKQPEEIIPGKPLFFASALTLGGYARGILVETHEGRPTKIEGNPQHPASLGATDVFMQAELLTLYDPERSQSVTKRGQPSTWEELVGELATAAQQWKANGGAGLRLLTRNETSPTLLDQMARLLAKYPTAKWHQFDPLGFTAGALYHFDKAEVILSLGADFIGCGPASIRYARDFARGRRPGDKMNRLYVAESTPTLAGTMADHRIRLHPNALEQFARDLSGGTGASEIAQIIAKDLRAFAGRCVVVTDDFASPALQASARHLNEALGNVGATVDYPAQPPTKAHDLKELVGEINAGKVETLVIVGGNPIYDAPADFGFAHLLSKIPRTIHLGLYHDETARACRWHAAEAHALESWSDARALDGTITLTQPMIEPLFGGRSRHELFSALLEEAPANSYEIVHGFWQKQQAGASFEPVWRKALHDGIANFQTGGANSPSALSPSSWANILPLPATNSLHLLIRPSPQLLDGRYANNAWLQEFPEPLTKIVWDNAALISPATAKRLQLEEGAIVNLKFRGRSVRAPIWILPGQADECVTVHLGFGRTGGAWAMALGSTLMHSGLPKHSGAVPNWRSKRPARHIISSPPSIIGICMIANRCGSAPSPNFRNRRRRSRAPKNRRHVKTRRCIPTFPIDSTNGGCRLILTPVSAAAPARLPAKPRIIFRSWARNRSR